MSREEAFILAERIRSTRADVIARLSCGETEIADVMNSEDPFVVEIKVVAVVESLPGLGKVTARRILGEVDISGDCRIRELDENRKRTLLDFLDSRSHTDSRSHE